MDRPRSRTARAARTGLATLAALVLASCTADSPTGPDEDPVPDAPVVVAPALDNVPDVPIPATPGGDVSTASAIHTTIARLEGDFNFNPVVVRTRASWRVSERRTPTATWTHVGLGSQWSHQVTGETASGIPVFPPPDPLGTRILLIAGGSPVQPPPRVYETVAGPALLPYLQRLQMNAPTFDGEVYVKRERQWELDSFDGGAFHLIASNQRVTLTEARTEGSSTTEITSFGTTVSAGGGLDILGLSGNIEKTLSRTFSTSVTVTEERTRQVSIDVAGEPGVLIDLRLWRLIDTYTLTDAQGDPLTHLAYVFDDSDGSMTWRTVAGTYPVQVKFPQ